MGAALADAALKLGHEVVIVSGPVSITYPSAAQVVSVQTTDELLSASRTWFAECDGAIGAAAPCDYMPQYVETKKIAKTGEPLTLQLVETPDVVAMLGQIKNDRQWVVGFALETEDRRFRATVKLQKKHCDMIVSNGPIAIDSDENDVELLDCSGAAVAHAKGSKQQVATVLMAEIDDRLIRKTASIR